MFRSEIGSGFEDPGGTPLPRIPRSTPLPPGMEDSQQKDYGHYDAQVYKRKFKSEYLALQVEDAQIPDYSCFVQANRETAEKLLTHVPKCKREAQNLEPRVVKARAEVEEAYKK